MASRSLTVVAKVKDAASAALNKVKDNFDKTGKSVEKTGINFTEFNRILFSTTAFVGVFTSAFTKMNDSLTRAGDLDRLSEQYSRVVGPKGELFKAINGMTKNSIDRMEAMRSGISLQTLGITQDTKQLAEIIARSGTAAKRAGYNSAEGIKRVTDFLKEGSVSSLSFLNVLAGTNPALQAQMSILNKYGGVMGTVISTQAKLRLGMAALRAATQGMENDGRDLADIMQDLNQSFSFVKNEMGIFLGKALSPVLEKVISTNFNLSSMIERIRTMDKTLLITIKNFAIVGSTLASVIATLGTARLAFKALGALGIGGVPFLAASLLGLAAAFTDVSKASEYFMTLFKSVGAVLLGTSQLVSSFMHDADNMANGIGKMDKELADFLRAQGLDTFTRNLARTSIAIIKFVQDVGTQLTDWFKNVSTFLDPVIQKIAKFFNQDSATGWSRNIIEGIGGVRGALIKMSAAALAGFGAFKMLGFGRNILGKLPVIGGLFGGGSGRGKGPAGTASDPIYTKDAIGAKSFLGKALDFITGKKANASFGGMASEATQMLPAAGLFSRVITTILNPLSTLSGVVKGVIDIVGAFAGGLMRVVGIVGRFTAMLAGFAALFAGGAGFLSGITEQIDGFVNLFKSIGNLGGAIYNFLEYLANTNTTFGMIYNAVKNVGKLFIDLPKTLLQMIFDGWKAIGSFLGIGAQELANKLNEASNAVNDKTAAGSFVDLGRDDSVLPTFGLARNAQSGQVGVASVPQMPDNEFEKVNLVKGAIDRLEGAKKAQMTQAFEQARQDGVISPEEWKVIFRDGINEAAITKHAEETAKNKPTTQPIRTQRC